MESPCFPQSPSFSFPLPHSPRDDSEHHLWLNADLPRFLGEQEDDALWRSFLVESPTGESPNNATDAGLAGFAKNVVGGASYDMAGVQGHSVPLPCFPVRGKPVQHSDSHTANVDPSSSSVPAPKDKFNVEPPRVGSAPQAGRAPKGGWRKKQNVQPVLQLVRDAIERCSEKGRLRVETCDAATMHAKYDLGCTHVKMLRDGTYMTGVKFEEKDFGAICEEFNAHIKHGRVKEEGLKTTLNSNVTRALMYHLGMTAGDGYSHWKKGSWWFDCSKARKSFQAVQRNNHL